MAIPTLTSAEMAAELQIDPATTIILTNEPSSQKAKQNDGQEDARTQQSMQVLLRSINVLSPKDGRPVVKFRRSPVRIERRLTPERCRGRELGILCEMASVGDANKLVTAWKKAAKKGERRQMIRWPVDKTTGNGLQDPISHDTSSPSSETAKVVDEGPEG